MGKVIIKAVKDFHIKINVTDDIDVDVLLFNIHKVYSRDVCGRVTVYV